MNTYTITTPSGETFTYPAESQPEAIRAHTSARPYAGVLSIVSGAESRARESMAE